MFLEQITITLPFLLMTLHLSHIGLTEGLTFIIVLLKSYLSSVSVFIERTDLQPSDFSAALLAGSCAPL